MTFMRYAYLFAAVAAVVLACTVPYWLPPEWARKKTKVRHSTEGSGFPFDLFSSADPNNERAASSSAPFPGSNSENNNNNNQQSKEDVFPFKVGAGTVKVFSKEELSQYVSNPLYLVVLGEVFDVTTGERFYAKGSGYHCFIGKDNSAAFHTGKFNETQEDIRGMNAQAIAGVVGWRSFFRKHETYRFVGVLHGLYFDENGMPTPVLDELQKATNTAAQGEAEDARRAKLYPRCNMHYDGIKKTTVVWCEGYKEVEDLKKIPNDKELRVLRMVHFKTVATGEDQKDCRCLRLKQNGEADIGSSPWPSARVDYYFKEKGCDPSLPRCKMNVA